MTVSTMQVEPLPVGFGAVVTDVSLRDLDDAAFHDLREAWIEYGLLIVPDQHLSPDEQDAVARRFGDLEFTATPLTNIRPDGTVREPDHALIKSLQGNEGWHHDSTYMPVQAKGAVFTAEVIPSHGGATGFADMRAAYEALEPATQQLLSTYDAHHSRRYSMERAGHVIQRDAAGRYELYGYNDDEPPVRPLVKVHPDTGRPNLVIGQHAYGIEGLSPAASEALLDSLNAAACIESNTHHHEWSVGDAIIWDNRRLMHRATPHDPAEPRRMWHTRIAGDPATESALNA